jgi:N-acetylmuramoyl-L-alanine amidase
VIDTSHLSDVQVLACTLYGEARSEPVEGILAVANVIRNRAKSSVTWWGTGFRGVCLAPKQFSCWRPEGGQGNYDKLAALVASLKTGAVDEARYKECAWIATGVINDWVRDTVKGADHYHAASMTPRPKWVYGLIMVAKYGQHIFYRSDAKAA